MEYSQYRSTGLPMARLQELAPAAFASSPGITTKPTYRFINTRDVIEALIGAGFQPTYGTQARPRRYDPLHARHMIRFAIPGMLLRRDEFIPEILLINAHDGTSNYWLRGGIYRVACANGLIVSAGSVQLIRVVHRGNIITDVLEAARTLASQLGNIGSTIEAMRCKVLTGIQCEEFAAAALRVRYAHEGQHVPVRPGDLLEARRDEDHGADLWRVFNVVQENLVRGGVRGHSPRGRQTRTRGVSAIRESVRINDGLWRLAEQFASAA